VGLAIWTAIEAIRGDFPERDKQEIAPVVWVIAGLAAQMLLLKTAGFSIATGLLFAFTARAFGKRKLYYSIPIGFVLSFVVWFIFARLLQLSLPAGPLERLFM
jgi:putative tricarboxylic transport membrane protein